jgi:hypothetical protein
VVAGVVAPGAVVAPVSAGSPGVVVVVLGVSVPPSQAPRAAARPSKRAKPKIFIFITPLSPNAAKTILGLLNKIPHLLLNFNNF